MQRCPNCRARYQSGLECRRCGVELESLLCVEQAAERYLKAAVHALNTGDPCLAWANLVRARRLHQDPLTEALLGFVRAQSSGVTPPADTCSLPRRPSE